MVEVIKKIAIDGIAYDVAGGGSTPAGEIDAKDVSFTAEMSSLVSDNVADALEEIAENSTLENLKDTSIQTPEQGEVVMFDSTTNKWHNTPLTTLNEGEPTVDGEYVGQMYKDVTTKIMYVWDGESRDKLKSIFGGEPGSKTEEKEVYNNVFGYSDYERLEEDGIYKIKVNCPSSVYSSEAMIKLNDSVIKSGSGASGARNISVTLFDGKKGDKISAVADTPSSNNELIITRVNRFYQ